MTVKELLSDESKWTQGALARDKNGEQVVEFSPNAVCWCLTGAIIKCYGHDEEAFHQAYDRIYKVFKGESIVLFNDTHSYEDVIKVVEEANV